MCIQELRTSSLRCSSMLNLIAIWWRGHHLMAWSPSDGVVAIWWRGRHLKTTWCFESVSPLFQKLSKFSQARKFWCVTLNLINCIYFVPAPKLDSFVAFIVIKTLFLRVSVPVKSHRSLLSGSYHKLFHCSDITLRKREEAFSTESQIW